MGQGVPQQVRRGPHVALCHDGHGVRICAASRGRIPSRHLRKDRRGSIAQQRRRAHAAAAADSAHPGPVGLFPGPVQQGVGPVRFGPADRFWPQVQHRGRGACRRGDGRDRVWTRLRHAGGMQETDLLVRVRHGLFRRVLFSHDRSPVPIPMPHTAAVWENCVRGR